MNTYPIIDPIDKPHQLKTWDKAEIERDALVINRKGGKPPAIDLTEPHRTRMLAINLLTLAASGALTGGLLASLAFEGWLAALNAIVGGLSGLFIGALCWAAKRDALTD